jgi:dihydroorotate dehydrogenase
MSIFVKLFSMYKSLIRPILFKFDPEEVHHFTFSMLKNFGFLTKLFFPKPIEDKRLEREVFGLKFKNPVGLAAGFDKNAVLFNELGDLRFWICRNWNRNSESSGGKS